MLPGHFHVFAFLVKLIVIFHAQQRINCEVLATDTCAVKHGDYYRLGNITRVDIPERAGMEGIDLRSGEVTIDVKALYENQTDITWSLKFYVKIGPPKDTYYNLIRFGVGYLNLQKMTNGSLSFFMGMTPWQTNINAVFGKAEEDVDSDWIELVGIKMKVSNKKKREVTSDNSGWKMIGIEYSKHPNEDGYLRFYINGTLFIDSVVQRNAHGRIDGPLWLLNGEFSCIQYHTGKMADDYFKDPNLKECKQKYEGEPKEKFVECEKKLRIKG